VSCWGNDNAGQLGQGDVGGRSQPEPLEIIGDHTFVDVVMAGSRACAREAGGVAWCWGTGAGGAQGNDTIFTSGIPREVRNDG
jgi:alpha-tubulin suppressor-like RCC1 family protein